MSELSDFDKELYNHLHKIWYDTSNKASFTGPLKLVEYLKEEGKYPNIGRGKVAAWLNNQEAYYLHKVTKKAPSKGRIFVGGMDETWAIDLIDYANKKSNNSQYGYILLAIDMLSRYIFGVKLLRKTPSDVVKGFNIIFSKTSRRPRNITCDFGGEFKGKFLMYLKEKNIKHYATFNDTKAAMIERAIRSVKLRINRAMKHLKTKSWIGLYEDAIRNYNLSTHRTISQSPASVNMENERDLVKKLYYDLPDKITKTSNLPSKRYNRITRYAYPLGSIVRIKLAKNVFFKGANHSQSTELFKVYSRHYLLGSPMYKIMDFLDQKIDGNFHQSEISKAYLPSPDKLWEIEKIISTKKIKNVIYKKIKWRGWPNSFNSLVKASDIEITGE